MVGSPRDVPLVGRARELAELRAAVTAAGSGEPRAVLLAGEAGVGKSRLVRELLAGPATCLRAQCVDLGEVGVPHLVVTDLARAVRDLTGTDPAVAVLLDRAAPRPDGGEDAERFRMFDAVAALLAEVGRDRGPVVVVVEDLQWADPSSADFLRFLLSRLTAERLAVVATVRTDGLAARPAARRLVSELGRLPAVDRIDLAPFGAEEVAEYLGHLDGVAPGLAGEVLRRTGGNPYYVETLAASIAREGRLGDGVPRALRDLLAGRFDGLPDGPRTVLRCAAVVAHAVPDRLLREVAGLADAATDDALRRLVADGLLVPDGVGYGFAHDLLRAAVYDDLLPGERTRLHASVAAALEAGAGGRAPAAEVAQHFAAAQNPSRTLVWSLRAADAASAVLAPAEALQHLERAAAAWPEVAEPEPVAGISEGRLLLRAARAAALAGEPGRSGDLVQRAIVRCDAAGDVVAATEARAELARQRVAQDAADPVGPAADAVRRAEEHHLDAAVVALAQGVLARALVAARRLDDARQPADQAAEAARVAGRPDLEIDALTTAAYLDELAGDRAGAADRLAAVIRRAHAEGELAAELRAHFALASLHYYNGDVAGALPVLRTAQARVAETGLRWSDRGVELRVLHAIALYVGGELRESLASASVPGARPPDAAAARLAAVACYAAVALGGPEAEARLAAVADSWDAHPQVALVAGGCAAEHLTWSGDLAGAVAVAERAQAHLDATVGEGMYGGLWLSALALAALADDAATSRQRRDDEPTAALVERGEVFRRRVDALVERGRGRPGDLGPEGHAWHARAVAEHARLRGEPAVAEWEAALAAFGYGHAYEQARCRWRLAEALLVSGQRDAARPHALEAVATAEAMGAVPLQRAAAALVGRGRLAGGAVTADAVLTPREQEVLALVAEGLTNREIGKRLFISEKTASVHLSNVMTKLNAASRTEAVTVAQRRGLLSL